MAIKKTPGPIMQKVRARVTRTKAEVKAATAGAATAVKKQVSGVRNAARAISDTRKAKVAAKKIGKKDNTLAYNVGEAFQTGKSKVFDSGRPNAAAGRARIKSARARKSGPIAYKDGQAYELSRNKRKAVRELISMRTDKGAEKATPKELRQKARRDLNEIISRPTTDAEKRKRDNKLQRGKRAATTGGGTNACRGDLMGTGGFKKK
jgi:hypothetical protein